MGKSQKRTTRIVAIANQKGGAGKTMIAVNLAVALGERGQKVLLVDVDPQFDATNMFGVDSDGSATLYEAMSDSAETTDAIVRDVAHNVDILPGSDNMATLELLLAGQNFRERYLTNALDSVRTEYDVILLDCPPNLGILSVNALVAADEALIPVSMLDRNAYKGAYKLIETINGLRKAGITTGVAGVVRNNVDTRRKVYELLNAAMEHDDTLPLLQTQIPSAAAVQTATATGQPLLLRQPENIVSYAIRKLADELIAADQNLEVAA